MRGRRWVRWVGRLVLASIGCGLLICGCQALSNRLTKWKMLGNNAVEDPLKAVGGDGIVFAPRDGEKEWSRSRLARASAQELVSYYAPVLIQQRVDTRAQAHPYPPEYDQVGQARLRRDGGELKAFVAGSPKVYAISEKRRIGQRDHAQLTYTAWYPAHPRMKAIDLEEADIDSCVVRLTLDADNAPLFYETIAACGCFHKVFVQRWLEEQAKQSFGGPLSGKKYTVEQTVKSSVDWEVAGLVDEPRDSPRRPVVFLKAGDHKVLGLGSSARLRVPGGADVRPYELAEYSELYSLPVDGTTEKKPFFDLGQGGKVWGAERKKERFLMNFIGVDNAGHPRSLDQIKLHFDQSTWSDTTIYDRFLRLPQGTL
jgi:hypothetical protein